MVKEVVRRAMESLDQQWAEAALEPEVVEAYRLLEEHEAAYLAAASKHRLVELAAASKAAFEVVSELEEAIREFPATTVEGIKAKLEVMRGVEEPSDHHDTASYTVALMLADLGRAMQGSLAR